MDIDYAATERCIAKKYRYYGSFTLFNHPRTRLIGLDKIMAMGLFSQSNDTCGQWRSHTARDQDWEQDRDQSVLIYVMQNCSQWSNTGTGTRTHCYRPQRSCGQGIFLHLSVIHSVHRGGKGVCLSACWDTTPPGADPLPGSRPSRDQTPPPNQTPPPGADTPPGSRLQHTVYERPVRILL